MLLPSNRALISMILGLGFAANACTTESTGESFVKTSDDDQRWKNLEIFSVAEDVLPQLTGANTGDKNQLNLDQTEVRPADLLGSEVVPELGLPPQPRKTLTHEVSNKLETALHFGIKGSFLSIVDAAAEGNVTLGVEVKKQLVLVRHAPHGDEPMLTIGDDDNEVRPVIVPDGIYRGSCVFEASQMDSLRWAQSLKIVGNGVSMDARKGTNNKVNIVSQYFDVKSTDSIASLVNICEAVFTNKVRKSIEKDLSLLIIASRQVVRASSSAEELALRAALYGPQVLRLQLFEHHWNIYPARINADGQGHVQIEGSLERSIRFQPDDQVDYKCEFVGGKSEMAARSPKTLFKTPDWKDSSGKLIAKICQEAFREFVTSARN